MEHVKNVAESIGSSPRNAQGGNAFPLQTEDCAMYGLTVRQYYAAKAMQTLLIDPQIPAYSVVAREAFAMADAMLKAEND